MFHDIFSKLKILKKKKKKTPLIIADIHEKNSLVLTELKNNKNIKLIVKSIKIGDYIIGKTVIERKTTSDFVSSMVNKRLIEQLNQMQKYKSRILIIEGDLQTIYYPKEKNKLNPNSIRGFILSIINNYKTNIIFTKNYEETSQYLLLLAKQTTKTKTEISLHSRIPKTLEKQKQYILEAFPNIGPKKAKNLLKRFNTLINVFNATEEELKEILKNRTKDFKDILNS